jgi:hypothetical protein
MKPTALELWVKMEGVWWIIMAVIQMMWTFSWGPLPKALAQQGDI